MAGISGIGTGLDIEGLVLQFMEIENISRKRLVNKQSTLESRKEALSDLDSKLSALYTIADRFTDILADAFSAMSAVSSDADKMAISAGTTSQAGTHDISISRLATNDTRVSKQYSASGSDLTALTGDKTFTISVAHPTDTDSNNRVDIVVTVAESVFTGAADDQAVMDGIAGAIDSAMSAAVSAETITSDEAISASVVQESTDTARMVLRSTKTGSTYAIQFTDTDGLLAVLELDASGLSTGLNGGHITATADLTAQFTMDGLSFERDSNTIDDVLTGITLEFKDTTTSTESFTISVDEAAIQEELESFMDAYNAVVEFLIDETSTDGTFRSDATYRRIKFDLRSILTNAITGALSSDFDRLSDIGIGTRRNGTLFMEDEAELKSALASNTEFVSTLFDSSDGLAVQLKDYIINFTKTSGFINSSLGVIDISLRYQSDRIDTFDDRVLSKGDRFRDSLIRMQAAIFRMQSQSAAFSNFAAMM